MQAVHLARCPGARSRRPSISARPEQIDGAVYLITDKGELRSAKLTGAFDKGSSDTSYTVEFTQYGQKVAVAKP